MDHNDAYRVSGILPGEQKVHSISSSSVIIVSNTASGNTTFTYRGA